MAAAVTSVFALELAEEAGYVQAELMVPEMFLVIIGTVAVYGLSAAPLGRWLKVAQPNPQGVMIVGAHRWARSIAGVLHAEGVKVLLVDTNRGNISTARLAGLPAHCASILSEYIVDELELGGLGRLLALTHNDEVNSLACLHFIETFSRVEVYQLSPRDTGHRRREIVSPPLRGRLLFGPQVTYRYLEDWFNNGAVVKKTALTEQFNYNAFQELYNGRALPLFLINPDRELMIFTQDYQPTPRAGQVLISVVNEVETK